MAMTLSAAALLIFTILGRGECENKKEIRRVKGYSGNDAVNAQTEYISKRVVSRFERCLHFGDFSPATCLVFTVLGG